MTVFPTTQFRKRSCWRIIPSRFPPVDLFRDVAPSKHWELIQNLESRTNERLREEAISRGLVRPEDRVENSSSHYILGALTHPNPEGSLLSDGSFGVVYVGLEFDTTLAEVKRQREEFLRRTSEDPQRLDMRSIVMKLAGSLHDFRGDQGREILASEKGKSVAIELRNAGSNGIVFDSTAAPGGTCVGVFRPIVLSNCTQERHFAFVWDGKRIVHCYEYSKREDVI